MTDLPNPLQCNTKLSLFYFILPATWLWRWKSGGGEREREMCSGGERERERHIPFFYILIIGIRMECNKQGKINENLIRILVLMNIFFYIEST